MLHGLARVCEAAARFHANDKEALRLIDSPDGAVEGCYTEDEDEGEDEAVAVDEMKQLTALYAMDGVEDLMDGGNAGGAHAGGTLEERPGAHTGFSARFDSRRELHAGLGAVLGLGLEDRVRVRVRVRARTAPSSAAPTT